MWEFRPTSGVSDAHTLGMTAVRHFCLLLTAIALGLVALGCGGELSTNNIARVRAINAINAPVDIVADTNAVGVGVTAGGVTGYGFYQPLSQTIVLRPSGTTNVWDSLDFSAVNGSRYSVIAYPTGASTYQLQVVSDAPSTPASGKWRLRFMHFNLGAGAYDVHVTPVGGALSNATRVTTISGTGWSNVTGYADLDFGAGGNRVVTVTAAGQLTPVGTAQTLAIGNQASYSVIVYNAGGPTTKVVQDGL